MENSPISITCNSCGAPLSPVPDKSYFLCAYCGAYYFPDPSLDGITLLGELTDLVCPVCKVALVTATAGEMHIQACPKCRGVMIKQENLPTIINTLRLDSKKIDTILPVNRTDLNQTRFCQTCGNKLDTHLYGGGGNVVIDVCNTCQWVWFDYGELKRIISAPDFGTDKWH